MTTIIRQADPIESVADALQEVVDEEMRRADLHPLAPPMWRERIARARLPERA